MNLKSESREKRENEESEKEKNEILRLERKLKLTQELQSKVSQKKLIFFKSISSNLDFIKYPVITEKTYLAFQKKNQYTFDVEKRLTKPQIKILFSTLFRVDVISINTHIPPRQSSRVGMTQGYRPSFKRVLLTLKKDQFLDYNINF